MHVIAVNVLDYVPFFIFLFIKEPACVDQDKGQTCPAKEPLCLDILLNNLISTFLQIET